MCARLVVDCSCLIYLQNRIYPKGNVVTFQCTLSLWEKVSGTRIINSNQHFSLHKKRENFKSSMSYFEFLLVLLPIFTTECASKKWFRFYTDFYFRRNHGKARKPCKQITNIIMFALFAQSHQMVEFLLKKMPLIFSIQKYRSYSIEKGGSVRVAIARKSNVRKRDRADKSTNV